MSREELSAFLRNLQLSLDGLQREVEGAIRKVPETKREALAELLAGCRTSLARFGVEQLAELDSFAEEAGLQLEGANPSGDDTAASTSYGGVQLRSLEHRVASMGGIPALGACVLPRMTPGMRPQLNATASPAAREMMQRQLGGEEVTPLKKTGAGEEEAAATPLVQLRATPPPAAGTNKPAAGVQMGPNSELAAAIQKRMQRLASKKDAAATPSKVACEG